MQRSVVEDPFGIAALQFWLGCASLLCFFACACRALHRDRAEIAAGIFRWFHRARHGKSRQNKLKELMDIERVSFFRRHALWLSGIMSGALLLREMIGAQWSPIPIITLNSLCLTVHLFPCIVTATRMAVCFVLISVAVTLVLILSPDVITPPSLQLAVLQVLLGAAVGNPKVTASTICATWLTYASFSDDARPCQKCTEETSGKAAILFWTVSFVWYQEMRVAAAAQRTLDASEVTEQRLLRLLYALCDAVVTLGPDLRVKSRAPKLASLLRLQHDCVCMEGTSFTDLMGESDRSRFREFLARAPAEADTRHNPVPAEALNVHLQVGPLPASWIQVQLFHNRFRNDDNDRVEHLIGICETGEGGNHRPSSGSGGGCVVGGVLSIGHHGSEAPSDTTRSRANMTDLDSESSFMAGDSASADNNHPSETAPVERDDVVAPLREQNDVSVVFDALRFKMHQRQSVLVDASLLERESLQQWVVSWDSSRAWLQDFVNAVLRPVNLRSWPHGPPSSISFSVSFTGTCGLPSDILTRKDTPSMQASASSSMGPQSSAESDNASRVSSERLRVGGGQRPVSEPADGRPIAPPTRLKISGVRLSRHRGSATARSSSASGWLRAAGEQSRGRGHLRRGPLRRAPAAVQQLPEELPLENAEGIERVLSI